MWLQINSNPPFEVPDAISQHYRIRNDEYRISEVIEEASKNIDNSGKSKHTAFRMTCKPFMEETWKKFLEAWANYPTEMHHVLCNKRGKNDDLESAAPARFASILPKQTYNIEEKTYAIKFLAELHGIADKYQFYNSCAAIENYLASYIQFTFEEGESLSLTETR